MKAAALHDDGHTAEGPGNELALVSLDARRRKPGNLGVGHAHRTLDGVGEGSEPRAEHDGDAGPEIAEAARDRGAGGRDVGRRLARHSNSPASVAERKFASVPAIMARKPSRARSCLRSGASALMPPI